MSEELRSGWYMPAPPTGVVFGWPPRAYYPFTPPAFTPYPQPPTALAPPAPIPRKNSKPIKIGFDMFLDAMNFINVPEKRKSRDGSSSTIELPRTYPPPYLVPYLHDPKPTAPLHFQKVQAPIAPSQNATSGDQPFVPAPSRQDLDGHTYSSDTQYRRVSAKEGPKEQKAEVFVKFHYCARCGRHRSKRYHREHPLMPRSTPVAGICRRCLPPHPLGGDANGVRGRGAGRTEVQEILIHRGQGAPLAPRCRSPIETIRVTRRHYSSSPKPCKSEGRQLRRSRSSEIATKVQKQKESSKGPKGRSVKKDPKDWTDDDESSKENVTEPSKAPEEATRKAPKEATKKAPKEGPKETPEEAPKRNPKEGPTKTTEETPKIFQSPATVMTRAWDPVEVRVRVGSPSNSRYERPENETTVKARSHREVDRLIASHPNAWGHGRMATVNDPAEDTKPHRPEAASPPRPPSPPEWYYRHVSREVLPRAFTVRRYRIAEEPEEPHASHRPSPAPQPGPVRGILQNALPKASGAPYREEQGRFPGYDRPPYDPASHVKFSRGTEGKKTARREQEATRDWEEEKHDQKEFDDTKRHLRHSVHRGGGPYEVDGHYSEESRQPDVSEEEVRSCYRTIPAPSHISGALVLRDTVPPQDNATGDIAKNRSSVGSVVPAAKEASIKVRSPSTRDKSKGRATTMTANSVLADTFVLRHSTRLSQCQDSAVSEHLAGSIRSLSTEQSPNTPDLERVYATETETKQSDGAWEADIHLVITEKEKPWGEDVTVAEAETWEVDQKAWKNGSGNEAGGEW